MEEKTENEQSLSEEQLQDITGAGAAASKAAGKAEKAAEVYSDTVIRAAAKFRDNAATAAFNKGKFDSGMEHSKGWVRVRVQTSDVPRFARVAHVANTMLLPAKG